jgi:hypothetical protein
MAKNNSPGLARRESVPKPFTNDTGDPCSNSLRRPSKQNSDLCFHFHFRANLTGITPARPAIRGVGEQEQGSRNGARRPGAILAAAGREPMQRAAGISTRVSGLLRFRQAQRRDEHPVR